MRPRIFRARYFKQKRQFESERGSDFARCVKRREKGPASLLAQGGIALFLQGDVPIRARGCPYSCKGMAL